MGRGTSRLSGLHIEDNEAIFSGGGIRLADEGVLLLAKSYVSNNRANASAGLLVGFGTRAEIRDSWFRENSADSTAAGIGISGLARIESTTISENEALGWFGGGIGVSDYGEMLLINSTVTLNKANNSGAGISSFAGGKLEVVNSTITDNQTLLTNFDQGGGIHVHALGSAVLTNTVVAGNQNGQVTDIFGEFEASHSFLAAVDESTVLNHQRNGNFIGSAIQPLDPKLGPLAGNGGSTPTQRPVADSPLLKAGLSLSESVRLDQRRVIRDIRPDIGAFEIPHGEEFTNLPPTLDPISDAPVHFLGLSSFQVRLTGITDGNQGLQPVILSGTSDNPALIRTILVGDLVDGTSQLTYQLRPGVSGLAKVTVTVRDAGNDHWLGTDDDGIRQRSFRVAVVDGFLVEAEQDGTNVNLRPEASAGATRQLQSQSPVEFDFQVQQAVRLSDLLIRHNNLVVGARLEVQVDGGDVIAVPLSATVGQSNFVIDSAQLAQTLTVGTHRLRLLLVGSPGLTSPLREDLETGLRIAERYYAASKSPEARFYRASSQINLGSRLMQDSEYEQGETVLRQGIQDLSLADVELWRQKLVQSQGLDSLVTGELRQNKFEEAMNDMKLLDEHFSWLNANRSDILGLKELSVRYHINKLELANRYPAYAIQNRISVLLQLYQTAVELFVVRSQDPRVIGHISQAQQWLLDPDWDEGGSEGDAAATLLQINRQLMDQVDSVSASGETIPTTWREIARNTYELQVLHTPDDGRQKSRWLERAFELTPVEERKDSTWVYVARGYFLEGDLKAGQEALSHIGSFIPLDALGNFDLACVYSLGGRASSQAQQEQLATIFADRVTALLSRPDIREFIDSIEPLDLQEQYLPVDSDLHWLYLRNPQLFNFYAAERKE